MHNIEFYAKVGMIQLYKQKGKASNFSRK
jgi:hypothetical protein